MAQTVACAFRRSTLTLCIVALSPAIALSQASPDVSLATTPATVQGAYVYVGTAKGVYLYDAASNRGLSLVSGSPFSIAGSAVGSNGKYFVSLGTHYLHSYSLASNGAIQRQVSQIDTQKYLTSSGDGCATTAGAVLDHTGRYIYAPVGTGECTAMQSYEISSAGALSFIGSRNFTDYPSLSTPAISGNDLFAYNGAPEGVCGEVTNVFERQSSGALQYEFYAHVNYPAPQPGYEQYVALKALAADPTDHLASPLQDLLPVGCDGHSLQLASYTQESNGDLVTTNSWQNMPILNVYPTVMNMSPSGDLLAVGGDSNHPEATVTTPPPTAGLQLFHFNGADPITPYSEPLTSTSIDQIHWDNNDHLYALSDSRNKLYVYTVTPSSITAVPGSPYTIASTPNALVVVPTSPVCGAPASDDVHICAPATGSTVSSPVSVRAASTVSGTISRMELWVDGVKKYTAASSTQINTTVSLSGGGHRFAVLAVNTVGQQWESAVNATVK